MPDQLTPQQPDSNNALLQVLQALLSRQQPQPQQPDFAGIFGAMRNTPTADANGGYIPGVQNQFNPFDNGFLAPVTSSVSPQMPQQGIPPRTDAGTNPYAFGAVGPAGPSMTPQFNTPPVMPIGPMQGMINPMLPDAQKFQDANFFGVSPQTNLPAGFVAGDDKERAPAWDPARKKKPGNFGAGAKPFMFGVGSK